MDSAKDVTRLLREFVAGKQECRHSLLESVYLEMKKMANGLLFFEKANHSLDPTELVHEAYIRLVGDVSQLDNRAHFYGIASRAMRRILVEHARSRNARKRGGSQIKISESPENLPLGTDETKFIDVLVLNCELTTLEKLSPRQCHILEMRFFGGLKIKEIATSLKLSQSTVHHELKSARAWLKVRLGREDCD